MASNSIKTDVSEERTISIVRLKIISEPGLTFADSSHPDDGGYAIL
jgi:hypothetical protein